jgi:GntR family transcriptional regulator
MRTRQEALLEVIRLEKTGVPIYVQVRDQLLRALSVGVLVPGEQMPTMRQVAVALRVDLNTVRRAYDELERTGAIVLQRGRGSFVATPPQATDATQLDDFAQQTLATAQALGIDPRAFVRRLDDLLKEGDLR